MKQGPVNKPASVSTAEPPRVIEAVVVPLDGSDHGIRALRVGKRLARELGCHVGVVSFSPSVAARTFDTRIRRLVRRTLESTPHSVMVRPAGPSVAGDIRLELALQPNAILCMPTHGHGRSAGLVGSVVTAVVAELPRPVLLVGPQCDGLVFDPGRPLLAAAGSSGLEKNTIDVAQAWATAFGSRVEQTTIADEGLRRGEIAEKIADDANALGASAIVMSTSARRGVSRMLKGSVAADVTRLARCPVLIHS